MSDGSAAGGVRVPPQDAQAEKALLGAVLIEPSLLECLDPPVDPDDFFYTEHAYLWRTIADLRRQGSAVDAVTVKAEWIKRRGDAAVNGEGQIVEFLSAMLTAPPNVDTASADRYARIVQVCAEKRRAIRATIAAQAALYNGAGPNGVVDILAGLKTEVTAAIDRLTPSSALKADTLAELLALTDKAPDLVTGLLRGTPAEPGYLIVPGASKLGKSAYVLDLALALATAGTWQETFTAVREFSVAYVQAELPRFDVKERIQKIAAGRGVDLPALVAADRFRVVTTKGKPRRVTIPKHYAELAKAIGVADILIFDPLKNYHNVDINSDEGALQIIDTFRLLCQEARASAFILIHHYPKIAMMKGGVQGPAKAKGSTTLTDEADAVILCDRAKAGRKGRKYMEVEFELRSFPEVESMTVQQDAETLIFAPFDPAGDREEKDQAVRDALDAALAANPAGATFADLQTALMNAGQSEGNAKSTISRKASARSKVLRKDKATKLYYRGDAWE